MEFVLNGESLSIDVDPDTPLLWALRDEIGKSSLFSLNATESKTFNYNTNNQSIYHSDQLYAYVLVIKDEEVIQAKRVKL